jgi:adenylosuccinate lyase
MEARDIFQNISPIDHRYSVSESSVYKSLVPWISEEALISSCIKAEIALVFAHLKVRGELTPALRAELEKGTASPAEV